MWASLTKLLTLLSGAERRSLAILVVLMLFEAALEMLGVAVVPLYITVLAYPERLIDNPLLASHLPTAARAWMTRDHLLVWGGLAMLALFATKTAYSVFLAYWRARFAQTRALKLSLRLFTAYLRAPYVFHLRNNSAELQRNINQECSQLAVRVLMPMVEFLSHLLVLTGITAVLMLILDLRVLAWLGGFLAVGMGLATLLQNRVKRLGVEAQHHRGAMIRSVTEGLGGVKEIQVLQRAAPFVERLRVAMANVFRIQRTMQVLARAIPQLIELIGIFGLIGVTLMLFHRGADNQEIIATLSVFAVALTRMKGAVRGVMDTYTEVRHNAASLDIVHAGLAELETTDESAPSDHGTLPLRATLELDGLCYRHPGAGQDSLRNVSLRIARGEAIGIVGASGAGKSTLIDLVLGVLAPSSGSIRVDGQDIRAALPAWQRGLGYVPQALFLVDGTFTENIALGIPARDLDRARLERAAQAAELGPLIARLPQGLDTEIGERGIRLSGGERQRIAIARALYHEPDVLILDEATSALDNTTEAAVIAAVDALKGDRTILMIAHRLSTVRRCDRIVFLKDGAIDAIGSFDELEARHAAFRDMSRA
ncbi:MAG: ABC transporter ATP-binding protein/permease [Gammaproteobacteria bacterium]|nr:ABC transporter ATP-binding protein/permease [Gammaproteobacteria bacterium]